MSTSVKRSEKQLPSKKIFSINGKPFIYLFTYLFFYLFIYLYTPESLERFSGSRLLANLADPYTWKHFCFMGVDGAKAAIKSLSIVVR